MMDYFSYNAFLLGALLFACLYISNFVYSLICIIWKIKIIEFALFFNPWFSLYNETVFGTKFILGWMPLGGHIKPLGMIEDEEAKKKIKPEDLPYASFNKPKYLKTIFRLVPLIVFITALFLSVILISDSDFVLELKNILSYVKNAFQTMFSDEISRNQFIITTREIIEGKNIIMFGFALLIFVMLLFTPISAIVNWYSNDKIVKSKVQKTVGFIVTLLFLWLLIWKIPKFIFSFFTVFQSLIYIISFLIGLFSVGVVFFFTTLFVIKSISQNLNYKNIERTYK